MRIKATTLSGVLLLAALALSSCGGTPPAAVPGELPGEEVAGERQIATVHLGASATREALLAAVPGAQLLSFNAAAGYAILSVPRPGDGRLSGQSLGALAVGAVTLEPDLNLSAPADPVTDAQGVGTWAGGLGTWAGGVGTWAGGLNTLDPVTLSGAQAYWNALGLPLAQALVPEQGAGVRVAVIDTGVDLNHPLLQGRVDGAAGWDYVNGDPVAQEEQWATGGFKYGHGTAVAGVILQVAPAAKILPYRVLSPDGASPVSRVIQALDRAVASGARVINLSLGSSRDSAALNTAVSGALARGVLVVNSSGNAGTEGMLYPARNAGSALFGAESGFLAVGSVGLNLYKSPFSTYGANMSLTAPGEGVPSAFPGGRTAQVTGTSFAAPAVSGALALAMSAGVTNPATLVRDLRATARANLDPLFKTKLGAGTLDVGAFVDTYR